MEEFLVLLVLVIIIGAFIVKGGELIVALFQVVKWLAIPLLIVGVIWLLSSGIQLFGSWLVGN